MHRPQLCNHSTDEGGRGERRERRDCATVEIEAEEIEVMAKHRRREEEIGPGLSDNMMDPRRATPSVME